MLPNGESAGCFDVDVEAEADACGATVSLSDPPSSDRPSRSASSASAKDIVYDK